MQVPEDIQWLFFYMVNIIILTICTLNISWKTLSKAEKHT
jgi:hypothetical protein